MDAPGDKAVISVRCRPLFANEIARNCSSVLKFPDEDKNIVILGKNGFEFDRIFSGTCQEQVYEIVQPLLEKVWAGYSATVIAYGQTGAGKTYSMGTGRGKFSLESEGVVPRTVRDLFVKNDNGLAKIFVSFMEVYNEGVYDLLSAFPTRKMQAKAFRDLGLQEIAVYSVEDALKRLEEGIEARRVSETQGNEKSSRSHAVFSLHIHRTNEAENTETRSLIHLVDLAGSEAVGKAGNQGSLKLEGISINQGLLALSNCIRAVIQKNQHIPVRNTALTNVLQDALKGQCLLALIACVSPSCKDEYETAQTLRFAQAFHKIKSRPHIQKIVAQHAAKTSGAIKKTAMPTPSGLRKPFSSIGNNAAYQLPSVRMSNYQFVTRRNAESPTEFEHSMCSSSSRGTATPMSNMSTVSIFSHFSEHELNEYMSNVLVEKIELLKKETEALVNKKIEDALRSISDKAQNDLENARNNQLELEMDKEVEMLNSTVIDLGETPMRRSSRISATSIRISPVTGVLVDLGTDSAPIVENVLPELTVVETESCSQPEEPVTRKLRRSVRLSCLALPSVISNDVEEDEQESFRLKRKLRRSVRLSCMELPDFLKNRDDEPMRISRKSIRRSCMPNSIDLTAEEVSVKKVRHSMSALSLPDAPQLEAKPKLRRSMRLSSLNLPKFEDVCSEVPQVEEHPIESEPAKAEIPRRKRKSIGPEILEEKLFRESPSAGTVQEKHHRRMLELINTECTKVLQQLPTVGPKAGYVIYSYRQINGPYSSFEDLHKVPGLSANFLKRFFKSNNIKISPTC